MRTNHSGKFKTYLYPVLVVLVSLIAAAIFIAAQGKYINNPVFTSQEVTSEPNQRGYDANEPSGQNDKKGEEPRPPDHNHPDFKQRNSERYLLVERYIKAQGIDDPNVLKAMRTVPRHCFVRKSDLRAAYQDRALYIGKGQTISQPYIVAYMTDALELNCESRVLEIGTGSGYQAAVCAEIAREVYTIEIIKELAYSAKKRLNDLGYHNVTVKFADGYYGWKEKAPFDTIIVTCAAGFVPPPLIEQLKPGGKIVLPLGNPFGVQTLVLVTKDAEGNVTSRRLLPVTFVPMTGEVEK